ncbi:MAG: carbamoyl phosphate synthase large subunit, partial [Candidatus Omnitrophica bacterium]|nr:carbamoyl phosphate synthase large subunit [Candidatus Omnitrophota bacterium]
GEVMGIDMNFGAAFAKSQLCAGQGLPKSGKVFLSVKDEDKRHIAFLSKKLFELGFDIVSTQGTAKVLRSSGVDVEVVDKKGEGENNVLALIKKGEMQLVINTPSGKKSQSDMRSIRAAAILHNVPCITTLQGAWAAVNGVEAGLRYSPSVKALQDYYSYIDK